MAFVCSTHLDKEQTRGIGEFFVSPGFANQRAVATHAESSWRSSNKEAKHMPAPDVSDKQSGPRTIGRPVGLVCHRLEVTSRPKLMVRHGNKRGGRSHPPLLSQYRRAKILGPARI